MAVYSNKHGGLKFDSDGTLIWWIKDYRSSCFLPGGLFPVDTLTGLVCLKAENVRALLGQESINLAGMLHEHSVAADIAYQNNKLSSDGWRAAHEMIDDWRRRLNFVISTPADAISLWEQATQRCEDMASRASETQRDAFLQASRLVGEDPRMVSVQKDIYADEFIRLSWPLVCAEYLQQLYRPALGVPQAIA